MIYSLCELCALPDDMDLKDALEVTLELENFAEGSAIKEDLFSIMLRALKHCYFFNCGICHMFRQIEINLQQRHFQKILWKKCPNEPVQIYKLKTITYGTITACYLSTRVLKQLAINEKDNFPIAANVVLQDIYLDDILTGCSSLHELELLKTELIFLFKSAGMNLHKWCFSYTNSEFPDLNFDQLSEEIVKTLGVLWNSSSYTLWFQSLSSYQFDLHDVLSQIARLFDPLGLLEPVISKPNSSCKNYGYLNEIGMRNYLQQFLTNGLHLSNPYRI
ncbi:hypothetical protein HNY73_010286 [Argiope bruennichi]|uniref:Uncharacterized protein n=1 Tax=Argiope bruennichi TaxID=94029 RepID=A0A8T0F2T6_ARGBR|nr:hypothetical protein HNY73_010286 [Argiope bruennichi]